MNLQQKTTAFVDELQYSYLNEEQQRIYNAFVFRRSKPYNFNVKDKDGNTLKFKLNTRNIYEGVLHILIKHYKTNCGSVTAKEIVNFCNVIRTGTRTDARASITFTKTIKGENYKLILGIKPNEGENVLKSFYSNKRNGYSKMSVFKTKKVEQQPVAVAGIKPACRANCSTKKVKEQPVFSPKGTCEKKINRRRLCANSLTAKNNKKTNKTRK